MQDRATILFVDDEERVVNLLRLVFRNDYHVLTATSGQAALDLMHQHTVDVLVTDQRMPGMMGIELLARVRESHPATVRVLLTGYSDLAAIVSSVNEGQVFRFVNKPWDHAEIKTVVSDAVAKARAAQQAAQAPLAEPVDDQAGVLLIDDSEDDLAAMQAALGSQHRLFVARNVQEALDTLEREHIGVLVSEARVSGAETGAFLRILKRQQPTITTVMLTRTADADLVIRMINSAQIHRFATKPLRKTVFETAVADAMREHQRLAANPQLASPRELAGSDDADDAALTSAVVHSLAAWRDRQDRRAVL